MKTYALPGVTVMANRNKSYSYNPFPDMFSSASLFGADHYAGASTFGNAAVEGISPAISSIGGGVSSEQSYGIPAAYRNLGYVSAAMGLFNGYKAAGQYEAQAQQAETNAMLTRQQSYQVGEAGGKAANDIRERGARMIGSQRAAYGASGVDSNVGTAAGVQSGTAYRTEQDAQTTLQNTAIKQWALGNEAAKYDAEAANYRSAAKAERRNSLLNTAIQVAKIYYGVGG